jgi:hypothetical protein
MPGTWLKWRTFSFQYPGSSLTPQWRKKMEGIREQLAALADQILMMRRRL